MVDEKKTYYLPPNQKEIYDFIDGNRNTALQDFMWRNAMLGTDPFNARRAFIDGMYKQGLLTTQEALDYLQGGW